MRALPELVVGETYYHFTVIQHLGSVRRKKRLLCRCVCGVEKVVVENDLRLGTTKSCGCFRRQWSSDRHRTHGQAGVGGKRTVLYRAWEAMRDRVRRSDVYVRRGITVCAEWAGSFEPFRDYVGANLGERPKGCSLDRIDNDRGYEPGNIRWATPAVQMRNRSVNTLVTVDGVTRCIAEWAEVSNLTPAAICGRIYDLGWDEQRAVTEPLKR